MSDNRKGIAPGSARSSEPADSGFTIKQLAPSPSTDSMIRLRGLLRQLFQLDVADLDFGIYRIFRLKRKEIATFLDKQLTAEVDKAFEAFAEGERQRLRDRVDELGRTARRVLGPEAVLEGGDPNPDYTVAGRIPPALKEYLDAREQLKQAQVSDAQRAEVFNLIYAFFSRYYEEGDFVPHRFFGASPTYSVPYGGEEVFFHWASKNQYYVKSGESLRDYAFTLPGRKGDYHVRFKLVRATTPRDNVKGEDRFFFPQTAEISFDETSRELVIPFEYRLPTEAEIKRYGTNSKAQRSILDEATPKIFKSITEEPLRQSLSRIPDGAKEESDTKSLLWTRLFDFTRKQTNDYFVHQDLRGFLQQEIEYFIRDQVVHELDLEGDAKSKSRILHVFKGISGTIIDFLSQIEEAQRKLFTKKKFALRTHYLVTVANVPRALWRDVLTNEKQLGEWKNLFTFVPKSDLSNWEGKINEKVLEQNPSLVIDTSNFSPGFTSRLLETISDLEDQTDGILVHGENFQALELLKTRYKGRIECIYLDPPFNTGDSEILYKNGFKFSSWLALMENRLTSAMDLLSDDPVLYIAIDDFEMADLCQLVDKQYPLLRREMIIVNHHPQGGKAKTLAATHEYMLACTRRDADKTLTGRITEDGIEHRPYKRSGTAESNFRRKRQDSFYAVLVNPDSKKVVGLEEPPMGDYSRERTKDGLVRVYPLGKIGEERVWRRSYKSGLKLLKEGKLECSDAFTIYQLIPAGERTPALFSNWIGPRYNAGSYGAQLLADIIGARNPFPYPKSVHTVEDAIFAAGLEDDATCIDFFGGSGTTAHAVINLNREDGQRRKFILVEMGDYFDTVLVPRIKKVIFAPEWKDGKPVRLATKTESDKSPRLIKVMSLESFEDSLYNTYYDGNLTQSEERLDAFRKNVDETEFYVRYMVNLPFDSSHSMPSLAKLDHPFDYRLEILTDQGPKTESVDLAETFNWLYGLKVHRLLSWVNTKDKNEIAPGGRFYQVVVATNSDDTRKVLVIWRDMTGLDPAVERAFLDDLVKSLGSVDEKWINGDAALPGFSSLDALFKRLVGGK